MQNGSWSMYISIISNCKYQGIRESQQVTFDMIPVCQGKALNRSNYLSFLWRFSNTHSKQVTRHVDQLVSRFIRNCYQTNNSRYLHYKQLSCGTLGIPKRHLIKGNNLLIYIHFVKISERLIKTCFNNFKIVTTKIQVLLFPRWC